MSAELNGMPASEIGLLLVLQCRSNIQADNVTTFKSTLDAFHIKQRKNDTDWCVKTVKTKSRINWVWEK